MKELKFSGDLRIRNQYDQRTPMILTNPKLGAQDPNIPAGSLAFQIAFEWRISSWRVISSAG